MFILKLNTKSLLKPFVLLISLSPIFSPLVQASDLNSLPEELILKEFSNLTNNIEDFYNFMRTSRRHRDLGHEVLKELRQNASKNLTLSSGSVILVDEAIYFNQLEDINSFNSPEAFSYFLGKAPVETFKDLWRNETFLASEENREPSYLSQLSQSKGNIISAFMKEKKGPDLTKQELTKLAYSLLFSMHVYDAAAWDVAWHAAWTPARGASWNAARDDAGTAARDAAKAVARNAARDDAGIAAWTAAWTAAGTAARAPARGAAYNAAYNTARDAAKDEISLRNLTEPQALGRLSYRVAEKVSLLYFLKEARRILDASFQAAYSKLSETIANEQNIFSSMEKWETFKTTNFSRLSEAQREFLSPWLLELDKLVAAIAYA